MPQLQAYFYHGDTHNELMKNTNRQIFIQLTLALDTAPPEDTTKYNNNVYMFACFNRKFSLICCASNLKVFVLQS